MHSLSPAQAAWHRFHIGTGPCTCSVEEAEFLWLDDNKERHLGPVSGYNGKENRAFNNIDMDEIQEFPQFLKK